jgi:hypothetical protein
MNGLLTRKRIVINGRNEYNGMPQHYCFDFDVPSHLNRKGNIEVVVEQLCPSFVPFFQVTNSKFVFNRQGVCISHPPGKRYKYHKVNAELVESHT